MIRKALTILIALLLLCSIPFSVSAADVSVTQQGEVEKGENITFEVRLTEAETAKSGSIHIKFNHDILEVVSYEWHLDSAMLKAFDPSTGMGVFAYMSAVEVDDLIFTVTFKVKTTAAYGDASITVNTVFSASGNPSADGVENIVAGDVYVSCMSHVPGDPAGCLTDQVCAICQYVLAPAPGHAEIYANITDKTHDVICSACEETTQSGVAHKYVDGKCVCGAEEAPAIQTDAKLKFVGNYLSFQEYIGMQTMLQTKLVKNYTKVYVEAIQTPVGGIASEPVILEPIALNSSYQVFNMQVMAWDMTDTITMTLYAEDAEGNVYKGATVTATVESLALEKLAQLDGTNAAGCRVLVDMLNYGAAVQSAYGHNAANLPNTRIGDYTKYATTGEISIGGSVTSSGKATGVSDYGIYVSMQAQVELTMMIKPKTGYSIENMEMRVTPEGGETRTFDHTTFTPNGAYYIPTVALKAADFRTPHTLAIYDKTTGKVLSKVHLATVEAKAAASLGTDYETVVVNMMKYGDAVAAMVAG